MAERFLRRWSRLKAEARQPEPPPAEVPTAEEPAPVDPETLPPIDSLSADSDYTPFLRPGVPEALKLLALRKAWASDPAIAGFRGLADYDWDCNAPGYGKLLPSDDIEALCRQAVARLSLDESESSPPPPTSEVIPPQGTTQSFVATPMSPSGTEGSQPPGADKDVGGNEQG